MTTPEVVWGGLFAAGVAYEAWALRTGRLEYTLSRTTRRVFRTNTRAGRWAFIVAFGSFVAWFADHILLGG